MIDEVDWMRAEFERVGRGAVLNNSPYDLAAAALILEEAGAVVTDASGAALGDRPLLGSGHEFQMSCVCARQRRAARGRSSPMRSTAGNRAAAGARVAIPGLDHRPVSTSDAAIGYHARDWGEPSR